MAKYSLRIKRSAAKELESIATKSDRQRIIKRIESLRVNPRSTEAPRLSRSERYRVRQANYRILYTTEDKALVVYVIKIGDRKAVYETRT